MNYIREMNAFIDWLETNPLEASTQTLWFHLMGIANKSGWPEWFTVANLTLQAKVGVTENTLNKHRNLLVQRGRIEYRNQGKQKAGRYRLISFTTDFTSQNTANIEVNNEVKYEANVEVKPAVNLEANYSALFKLNNTKQDLIDNRAETEDRIRRLINELQISGAGMYGLDLAYSYIGQVETGVIETALKRAQGKHIHFFRDVINGFIAQGKTTVESLNPVPKAGERNGGQGKAGSEMGTTSTGQTSFTSQFSR